MGVDSDAVRLRLRRRSSRERESARQKANGLSALRAAAAAPAEGLGTTKRLVDSRSSSTSELVLFHGRLEGRNMY